LPPPWRTATREERSTPRHEIDKGTFEQHVRFFNQGAVIFKENDDGSEMFIIIQGIVEIRKSTGQSSSKILTTLQKGDMFGEMAIIEKQPRSASAIAVQPTGCWCSTRSSTRT